MSTDPVRKSLATLGLAGWVVGSAARGAISDVIEQDELAVTRMAAAFGRLGWQQLPVLAVLSALIGIALGSASARLLHTLYIERVVEPAVVQTLARDIVPLLIGIFAAGRVAVETAVRLGAMRLASEIDALRVTGQSPIRYVIAPALASVILATPLQMAVVFGSAWIGFACILDWSVITPFAAVAHITLDPYAFRALLKGCSKALIYNVGALTIGTVAGLSEDRGINAIGRNAMRAFTGGLLFVIAAAACSVVIG